VEFFLGHREYLFKRVFKWMMIEFLHLAFLWWSCMGFLLGAGCHFCPGIPEMLPSDDVLFLQVDITVDMLERKEPPPHMEIPSNKRSWVAEKPPRKGPSLEKLIGMWKAAETAARQKKDAEVEAAQKVVMQAEIANFTNFIPV